MSLESPFDAEVAGDLPAGYAELPECIQQYYTPAEYLWLSDLEKANLIQSETEPDFET